MATKFGQNSLLDKWLTIQDQGQDRSTGEGDGPGLQTDWGKLFGSAADQYETARRLGYAGAMPAGMSGDTSDYQAGNPQQELFDWMKSSGYNYGINPTFNGGQENVWLDPQGNEVEGTRREFEAPNDREFGFAASLAAALGGGMMGAGMGLGSAGIGAMSGGAAAGIQDASLSSIAKGAALGGIAGYGMGQFGAPDAMADYMRTGAAEGSTIGNAYTGAGGQAGAVGANSIAAQMAIPSDFDPNSLFRNVADPTKALEPLGDVFQMPGSMPNMSGGVPSTPTATSLPYEQTVEITAPRIPDAMPREAVGNMNGLQPPSSFRPSQNYGEGMTGAETAAADAAAKAGNPLLDFIKANPRLAISALSSIGGKLFGGSQGPTTPSGGISGLGQAGMTAQQAPAFSRQYVAAPEGYRPGFSPQHKYFTGIGSVGMAAPTQPQVGIPQEPSPATRG